MLGTTPIVAAGLILGAGIALSATVTPSLDALTHHARGSGSCDLGRIALASSSQLGRAGEVALNVLLLVPMGSAIGLLPRRRSTMVVLAAAVALPFAVEATQLVVVRLGRECQAGDVIDNLTGLALGALITAAVRWTIAARANLTVARAEVSAAIAAWLVAGMVLTLLLMPDSTAAPPPLPAVTDADSGRDRRHGARRLGPCLARGAPTMGSARSWSRTAHITSAPPVRRPPTRCGSATGLRGPHEPGHHSGRDDRRGDVRRRWGDLLRRGSASSRAPTTRPGTASCSPTARPLRPG